MKVEKGVVYRYTNRKGRHYYLHQRRTKAGKARHVFTREVGDGALNAIPDGFEVRENVNGIVSLAQSRAKQSKAITELEEQAVRTALAALALDEYRLEARGSIVTIFEPDRHKTDGVTPLADHAVFMPPPVPSKSWLKRVRFEPVLRFVLAHHRARVFHVERMTYRGNGGWSHPLGQGKIADLAKEFLRHLGRKSFFDLC